MIAAAVKTMTSPWWNAAAIRCGKNCLPVSTATLCAGSLDSTPYGVLSKLPAHSVAVLTGRQFFPHLIAAAFHHGLVIVFTAAAIMSVTGALVSLLRGKQFYYDDERPLTAGPAVT